MRERLARHNGIAHSHACRRKPTAFLLIVRLPEDAELEVVPFLCRQPPTIVIRVFRAVVGTQKVGDRVPAP